MPNERLRAALLERGLTPTKLGDALGVNTKTIERWINGRLPYRRHRYAVAAQLGLEESYLWPDALPSEQVAAATEGEIVSVYPHRSEVPRDAWMRFFESAERELDMLVYAGQFLAEDAGVQRTLADRADSGVRIRLLLGDPAGRMIAQRAVEEGAEGMMPAKIRGALVYYRPLVGRDSVEVRFHDTPLYNSIYRADDELLVNSHIYSLPAARGPVWHLRKVAGGDLVSTYMESYEHVWQSARPVTEL
jgi:transcriptional regulator with XRE-family HTH domain